MMVMNDDEALLSNAYAAYNSRDLDGLLAVVSEDVDWPDGRNRLRGKAAVEAYWTNQWKRTRTFDRLVAFDHRPARVAVRINQIVWSCADSVISSGSFTHVHQIQNGRIVRMDIEITERH